MCSTYLEEGSVMDNYQGQGDLTDILRLANRVGSDGHPATTTPEDPFVGWQFPLQHDDPAVSYGDDDHCDFGDPFSSMKDPLLHELELVIPNSSSFFSASTSEDSVINRADDRGGNFGGDCEVFPRDIAFSSALNLPPMPSPSPPTHDPPSVTAVPCGMIEGPLAHTEVINNTNSSSHSIDATMAMQISAARNSGLKRRKGQAKKVVCIPAPAAANSRAGGEVVPSDLWAWRKYGQKPIKGSPYPRGYYRCSSSKGCSARKQVERSRTDPNMLVITYTSEHNHPWPTQRNALAGSTRANQSANKNNSLSKTSSSSSLDKHQQRQQIKKPSDDMVSLSEAVAGGSSMMSNASVKEEMEGMNDERSEGEMMGLDQGWCGDDFLFQDLEDMDGGNDPFSFWLDQEGLGGNNSNQKSSTAADSDCFGDFFDLSD